jgi:aminodeoxyfutalosine synthase
MLARIQKKVLEGKRLPEKDALKLFETDDLFSLGRLASFVAEKKNGKKAYYIRNRHINPTNICVNRCRFCAFSRSIGQKGAFELTIEDIIQKIGEGQKPRGKNRKGKPAGQSPYFITEVHIVGGLHPQWPFEHYLQMLSTIKKHFPGLHIKAFTAVEIDYLSRIGGLNLKETLSAL